MGLMNKIIGAAGILGGLIILILQKELVLPIALIILGIVFIIFNHSEDEYEKRTDEKDNHHDN